MDQVAAQLDFQEFHKEKLPALLAAGNGSLAANAVGRLGSLAFRVEGEAYTYSSDSDGILVSAGDGDAETVIELTGENWSGIVGETLTAPGLLYSGRVQCLRGQAMHFVAWEPALRAMYTGRPVWDADAPLFDRDGNRLDPERSFTLADDRYEMAHFLRTTGYLFVREVFGQEEIDGFLSESDELRAEAVKGDQLSWWGKNERGEEILCRITRAAAKPKLRSIPADPRMTGLAELSHENLEIRKRANAEEGVSLIYKQPAMVEGLSNLPWHRDCGMGGHALVCPVLIASVFLTESNPETGDLCMLPGSWNGTAPYIEPDHPRAPQGVRLKASPGDVSLHYGDTMHAAPAPADSGRSSYRISAVTAYAKPDRVFPKQKDGFNSVLHQSGDGQIEHLSKVTDRLSKN